MLTSFHHQSEAQHPKSSAIHKYAGRLPHLWVISRHNGPFASCPLFPPYWTFVSAGGMSAQCHKQTSFDTCTELADRPSCDEEPQANSSPRTLGT